MTEHLSARHWIAGEWTEGATTAQSRNPATGETIGTFWDGDADVRSNVIDVYVGNLRAKVDKPFGRSAIQTVRGAGYRLDPAGG